MWRVQSCGVKTSQQVVWRFKPDFFFLLWRSSFWICWSQIKYSEFIPLSRDTPDEIFLNAHFAFLPCLFSQFLLTHTHTSTCIPHSCFSATNMHCLLLCALCATDNLYEAATPLSVFITQSDGYSSCSFLPNVSALASVWMIRPLKTYVPPWDPYQHVAGTSCGGEAGANLLKTSEWQHSLLAGETFEQMHMPVLSSFSQYPWLWSCRWYSEVESF